MVQLVSQFRGGDAGDRPAAGEVDAFIGSRAGAVVEALRYARPALLVDEVADRGWLFGVAATASADLLTILATHGHGPLRAAAEPEHLRRLGLQLLDASTGVHAPLDARGAERGRLADRIATLHALADVDAPAERFVVPGHVVPVAAGDIDCDDRPCVARAMVEACRLARATPVAVCTEVAGDDGAAADAEAIVKLAAQMELPSAAVIEVLASGAGSQPGVARDVEAFLPTPSGELTAVGYRGERTGTEYVAFTAAALTDGMRVHVHRRCLLGDAFGGTPCGCGEQLQASLSEIQRHGNGVVVYQADGCRDLRPHDRSASAPWRVTAEVAAILRDLGARSITLTANERLDLRILRHFGVDPR